MSIQRCESTKNAIEQVKKLDQKAREAFLISEYETSAKKGDSKAISEAAFNLAVCYDEGLHKTGLLDTSDITQARKYYEIAAGLKHPAARCNLGVLHYSVKDYPEACRFFKLAADQGNAAAQFNLAERYRTNKAAFTENAIIYYRLAALQNHKEAREQLAECHHKGIGVTTYAHNNSTTDTLAANAYKLLSGDPKDPYAEFRLGICYLLGIGIEQNLAKGLELIMKNADYLKSLKGNTKDFTYVARYYDYDAVYIDEYGRRWNGVWREGYSNDFFTPILPDLLTKIATSDHNKLIQELNEYGQDQRKAGYGASTIKYSNKCYLNAFRSFSLAAALGSADALYELGEFFYRGGSYASNNYYSNHNPTALKYFRLAAKQNHKKALERLIYFHTAPLGGLKKVNINDANAVQYYSSMAEEDPYAASLLVPCYFYGKGGVACDTEKALKLINEHKNYLGATQIVPKDSATEIQLQAMLASTLAAPIVNIAEPFFNTSMPQNELIGDARKKAHQEARKIIANPALSSNSYDSKGIYTILIRLINHGFTSLVRMFLRKKPNLALTDQVHGRTALHWAVIKGNYLIVRDLLALLTEQERLDLINAQDIDGLTPLMLAASAGHLGIVKMLYQAGAKPNIADRKHETALTKAENFPNVLSFLASLNLPKDRRDSKASNPDETEKEAYKLISAIKDADDLIDDEPEEKNKDVNVKFLKEFFRQVEKIDTDEQLKRLIKILTYVDHHGRSAQDYAVQQDNTYVMRQLTILTALLGDPGIASRIPASVPETNESRSRKLWDLIVSPLKYPPEKNVDLFNDARKKNIRKAKALIEEGVDLNFTDSRPGNILIYLILHDYTSLIHQVFDAPDEKGEAAALITKKDAGSRTTALHWAAYKGNPEVVTILLDVLQKIRQLDTAINNFDDQDYTPLMAAIAANNISAATLFIANGANCRLKNLQEKSAYDMARESGLNDLIQMMDRFAKIGEPEPEEPGAPKDVKKSELTDKQFFVQPTKEERSQALINAIKDGDRKKANQLLSQEFDPKYGDCHGFNVLHHAAASGDVELISKLLKHPDIDIDAVVDGYGEPTALDLAANFNHLAVIQILLNAKAKLTPMKNINQLPMLDAKKDRAEIDQEITIAKDKASILLQDAKKVDHVPTILQLQKQGFAPKNAAEPKQAAPKETKQTPFFHAAKIGDAKTVRDLLKTNPDLNEVDEYGYTPLHWAVQNGHMGIISALLDNKAGKADIEAKDSTGATPLFLAILHRRLDVVRALVRSGANIDATDKQGRKLSHYLKLLGLPEDLLVKSAPSSTSSPVTTAPHSTMFKASSSTTESTSTSAPSKPDPKASADQQQKPEKSWFSWPFSSSSAKADGTAPTPKKPVEVVVPK